MKKQFDENPIVIGCNYHTKWQSDKQMRFVLSEIKEDKAKLTTRTTNKSFWTNKSDLVFILSSYNISKAKNILSNENIFSK